MIQQSMDILSRFEHGAQSIELIKESSCYFFIYQEFDYNERLGSCSELSQAEAIFQGLKQILEQELPYEILYDYAVSTTRVCRAI